MYLLCNNLGHSDTCQGQKQKYTRLLMQMNTVVVKTIDNAASISLYTVEDNQRPSCNRYSSSMLWGLWGEALSVDADFSATVTLMNEKEMATLLKFLEDISCYPPVCRWMDSISLLILKRNTTTRQNKNKKQFHYEKHSVGLIIGSIGSAYFHLLMD